MGLSVVLLGARVHCDVVVYFGQRVWFMEKEFMVLSFDERFGLLKVRTVVHDVMSDLLYEIEGHSTLDVAAIEGVVESLMVCFLPHRVSLGRVIVPSFFDSFLIG